MTAHTGVNQKNVKNVLLSLPAEARLQALRELSRQTGGAMFEKVPFTDWLPKMTPRFTWNWPYIQYLIGFLEKAERREINRLAVSLPPRHGKSTLLVHFAAWMLETNPSNRIIVTAYSQALAERFSAQIRKMVASRIDMTSSKRNIADWETPQGGGVRAAGVGTGVTGMGGNCLPAGTMVATACGDVAIEELPYSPFAQEILSWDTDKKQLVSKPMLAFSERSTQNLHRIFTDSGNTVTATGDHRFWTVDGYTEADRLAVGDPLLQLYQKRVIGDAVAHVETLHSPATVYDIQVADTHNFFANGVLVHNCIIIDDPVKNRKEANSPTYRKRVYDWFTDDLYTRLEPDGIMIGVATRWHEDDLFGRIINSEEGRSWEYISLPAMAEENDPLGRKYGEALNPTRYPIAELERIKTALGRGWWALYQQRPQEQEGDMFMRSWFQIVPEDQVNLSGMSFCRYWDKASAGDGDKAQTAGILMGEKGGNYYIFNMVMGDWKSAEREDRIKRFAISDTLKYGHVTFGVEQEPGSGGKDSAESTISNLAGFSAFAEIAGTNKVLRAEPLASQAAIGRVTLIKGDWNEQFLDIITSFPNADLKDPVDAASGAFKYLSKFSVDWQALLKVGLVGVNSGRWI